MSIQNILIVEDSRLINQALNERLTKNTLDCVSAYDLKTAHEIYDTQDIDLIILDLHLPDGEGEEFILEIKAKEKTKKKKVKIIVFTSSADLSRRDELFRLGIVDYLNKGKHADIILHDVLTIIKNLNKNSRYSILIVDDSSVVRLMMRTLLEPHNYTILEAKSVDEAQTVLKGNSVDLILLDLEMHGISGMDFLKQLKSQEEYLSLPVSVVSSHSEVDIIRDAYKNGATNFFKKPFPPEEFTLKIQQQIDHKAITTERDNLLIAYKEYKNIVLSHSLYATFKKSGRIDFYNEGFEHYFKNVTSSLQKIFATFFEPAVINSIISAQRSHEVYKDVLTDKHGKKFRIRCFTSSTNVAVEEFHVVFTE